MVWDAGWKFCAVLGIGAQAALAIGEPNNTFATAAVVSGPQLVVDRMDFVTAAPDTTLVVRDANGAAIATDDDSSFFGNGRASALLDQNVNSDGSIRLAVSGAGDLDFDGLNDIALIPHAEAGYFEAYITLYLPSGNVQTEATRTGTLTPGQVLSYQLQNSAWVGSTYDLELSNFFGPPSDVDYWAFHNLTPGLEFSAEVIAGEFDAVLGSFDADGNLLDADDDSGAGSLPRLTGIVPANGVVTLAVSGYADFGFNGTHSESGTYSLQLTVVPEPTAVALLVLAGGLFTARRFRAA